MTDDTHIAKNGRLYFMNQRPLFSEDKRPVPDLIRAALGTQDEEERERIVQVLQEKDALREVFDAARELSSSTDPKKRALGAEIVGFLGFPNRPFRGESIEILLTLIGSETDSNALYRIVDSLFHLESSEAIQHLIPLTDNPDADVRMAVARALGSALASKPDSESAIRALVKLSADQDRDVRDSATFELASETVSQARPDILESLWNRVGDDDPEIRAEALLGLVRRHHPMVLEALAKELSWQLTQDYITDFTLQAAKELADSSLCPLLLMFRQKGWDSEWVDKAISACGCKIMNAK